MSSDVIQMDIKNTCEENTQILLQETCQQKIPRLHALKQLKIALCVTIGSLTTGYTAGWTAAVIQNLKEPIVCPLPYLILDSEASWVARSMIIGAIVGCITSSFIADRIGRKPTLMLSTCFNLFGYTIMAEAVTVSSIATGRMLAGVTTGSISVLNVVYLGEIASPEIRGSLIAMAGIMHVFGRLIVYSLGTCVTVKVLCYVCIGMTCLYVLALCYVPESPVYQVMKGKIHEARLILHDLGRTGHIEEEIRLTAKDSNEALLPQANDDKVNIPKRIRKRVNKKDIRGLFMTTVLLCIQAGGGCSLAIYYATQIFKSSSSSVNISVGTVVLALTELCGVILTPVLVERCGRRIMLMMSLVFCCLFMVILGTYFHFEAYNYMIISFRWLPIVLLMLFIFSFNFGLGVVPNIFCSEMYSSPFRTTFCSISMSVAWFVLYCNGYNFEDITPKFSHGVFWIYAGINAMGLFFCDICSARNEGEEFVGDWVSA